MENINPLEIQKLYNEQKEVLKQWEKKFQQEHQGQKPTKEEIIRYGMGKLKKQNRNFDLPY